MRGESYSDYMDAVKHRTKFSYHCPNCNHGPYFTAADETNCPACEVGIKLTRNIDGDIIVELVKKPKRP